MLKVSASRAVLGVILTAVQTAMREARTPEALLAHIAEIRSTLAVAERHLLEGTNGQDGFILLKDAVEQVGIEEELARR